MSTADLKPGQIAVQPKAAEGEFIPANKVPLESIILGPKMLLLGPGGVGKSHALSTLEKAGLEVACVFTEPSGLETLSDITSEEKFHWMYIPPGSPSMADLANVARYISTMSFKSLTEMGDIDKGKFNQWRDFIAACADFKCQRCGKHIGPLDKLGPGWATALDSLSGMNELAMKLVTGLKPVKSPGDWGVAMDNLGNFVTAFTTGVKCLGVITAHLEREIDPNTGAATFQASTLGQKLAPKIGRFFSDIVLAKRDGKEFSWSTGAFNVDLKARNLPVATEKLKPDFAPIVEKWHKRIGYKLP